MTERATHVRRAARRRVALAAAALLGAACTSADDASPARSATAVHVVGGIEHVVNTGEPPTWRLEESLAVADAGGEPFGRITGVTGSAAGELFVADELAKRIYRFGADGRFVAALGREGGGPGEFRSMHSLAWTGPWLATLDAGNARVTRLGVDGAVGPPVHWLPLTGTGFGLEQTTPEEAYAPFPIFSTERRTTSTRVFLRITADGVADTLAGVPVPPAAARTGVVCEGAGGIHFFSVPHAPRELQARAPGRRTIVAHTSRYRLLVLDAAGDTLRVVSRDVGNPPFGDAEWAATEDRWREFQERVRGARCEPTGIERPTSKPAFAAVFFDDAARTWVEAYDTAGFRFDVFDSTGALVAQLPAPPRDRSVDPAIRGGRLHYVAQDSLEVQTVRVARIVEERK